MLYEKHETSYFALKFSSAQNQIISIAPSLCCLIFASLRIFHHL